MKTLNREIRISGVGVHSGAPANIVMKPSGAAGVFFARTDLSGAPIPATYDNVGATHLRNTTIGDPKGAHVQTIEHVMAALHIMGIDGAAIEIDGPEMPILDGSARRFCDEIAKAGDAAVANKKPGGARPKAIVVKKEIKVESGDSFVCLKPDGRGLFVSARIVYPEPIIGDQSCEFLLDGTPSARAKFVKEIAAARTFGKLAEWDGLKKMGMARGADDTTVIALSEDGASAANPPPYGLYWPDEFARHKVIDIIGDMYTAGGRIIGAVESFKGSHALNNAALKKLFENAGNYDIIQE
jgi:UDP-3-O-[3-hydroxymyristoyl] N-acetylglucosamine deacetylase